MKQTVLQSEQKEFFAGIRHEMRIILDNERITKDGIYTIDAIVDALDRVFSSQFIMRDPGITDCLCYYGTQPEADFVHLTACMNSLEQCDAFMSYCLSWYWYRYDDYDFNNPAYAEDVLQELKEYREEFSEEYGTRKKPGATG